jgi:transitional endoplasmic reticulum ATPase
MNDYLKHRPDTASNVYDPLAGWDALALPQDTVNQLRIMAKMLREGDPLAPCNLLLFGPQESNKTEVVRQFARETARALIVADVSDVMSAFIGQATQTVAHLFAHARASAPCVLFFNDVEMFAAERGTPLSRGATDEVVLQLLTEIEINREINRNVFLVVATARPEVVDAAIRSHIACHIEIPVPGPGGPSVP